MAWAEEKKEMQLTLAEKGAVVQAFQRKEMFSAGGFRLGVIQKVTTYGARVMHKVLDFVINFT